MSELELMSGEEALATRNLLHVYGRVLSARGTLHLTSKRIVFEPSGRIDRAGGARRVSIPLRSVSAVEYRGTVEIKLVVRTERAEHVFLDRKRDELLLAAARSALSAIATPRAAHAAATGPATPAETEEEQLSPTGTILVLGNTDFYGTALSDVIDNLEIEARCVDDADAAIRALEDERADICLAIVNLLEARDESERLLAHLRSSGRAGEVPLWVIEPLFEKTDRADLTQAGVDGYLDKSLEPNGVSDLINQLLRGGITPERRRHPRVRAHFAVEIQASGDTMDAYARTIGMGGCFVETRQPRKLGTAVTVRFRLPDHDDVVVAAGEVVYMRPAQMDGPNASGMGIKFRGIDSAACEAIATYIREKVRYKVDESTVTFGL